MLLLSLKVIRTIRLFQKNKLEIATELVARQVTGAPGATQDLIGAKQVQRGDNNVATVDQGTSEQKDLKHHQYSVLLNLFSSCCCCRRRFSCKKLTKRCKSETGTEIQRTLVGIEYRKRVLSNTKLHQLFCILWLMVSNHYQYGNRNVATLTQNGTELLENTMQIGINQ
jgi:hypothetical protein